MPKILIYIINLPIITLLSAIKIYQKTLSPDHSIVRFLFPAGVCRFKPTCSQYMAQALAKHGWYGLLLGLVRIVRCHPGTTGGIDPVPSVAKIPFLKSL